MAGLIDSLTEARAAGELSRRLRVLTHPALLVVDEIGYLPVSQDGAVLFFQLINARHERASTVLTSNKGFEEWGSVLGDEVMAAGDRRSRSFAASGNHRESAQISPRPPGRSVQFPVAIDILSKTPRGWGRFALDLLAGAPAEPGTPAANLSRVADWPDRVVFRFTACEG